MYRAKITVRQGTHNAKRGQTTLYVSHRFNEIKQKTFEQFEQFVVKIQPQIITNYHKQYTTENTNLIHPNPICTNFNYDRSLVRDKKRLDFSSRVSWVVGVDGFEPPTLCL